MVPEQPILRAIGSGLLLSGLIVGTWEFGEFVSLWRGRIGPTAASFLAPWGLFLASFSDISVPWAIYAIGVAVLWLWEPRKIAYSATVSFMFAWELERLIFFPRYPIGVGGGVLLLCAFIGSVLSKRLKQHPVVFLVFMYTGIVCLLVWFQVFYMNSNLALNIILISLLSTFVGVYSVFRNHRARNTQRLRSQATTDPLTGALTRNGFEEWMAIHKNQVGAVFVIDLDDFKPFNDLWGHQTGDEVLKHTTRCIRSICDDRYAVVRLGGDEFAIWGPGLSGSVAQEFARRLHNSITTTEVRLPQGRCVIQASLGWAAGILDSSLASNADEALLQCKRYGKNRMSGFQEELVETERISGFSWWEIESIRRLWNGSSSARAVTNVQGTVLVANRAFRELDYKLITPQAKDLQEEIKTQNFLIYKASETETVAWAMQKSEPVISNKGCVYGFLNQVESLSPANNEHGPLYGLDNISIRTVFQPIINPRDGSTIGFEALSRPRIDDLEFTPQTLFSLAHQINQVIEIDLKCISSLIRQMETMGTWPQQWKLFVNVRVETILDFPLWTQIQHELEKHVGIGNLVWELSEQNSSELKTRAIDIIESLSPHSDWAIDDWGSGEHPVSLISSFSPPWIKIDKEWIHLAMTHRTAKTLLLSLLQWTEREKIRTVAEGIETLEQAAMIREWGFSAGQGYIWGKPEDMINYYPYNSTKF